MTSAVVVGSGPNGLAAAVTLARAGVEVTVYEAADDPGGGITNAPGTPPGITQDHCAAFHPMAAGSPFLAGLRLAELGVEWLRAPIDCAHPLDGGDVVELHQSVSTTASGLGRDGKAWSKTFGKFATNFSKLSEDVMVPLIHVPKHPLLLATFGLTALRSAVSLSNRFTEERTRALFLGVAAHAFQPLTKSMSSAIGLSITSAGHAVGWPVVAGGTGRLAGALVQEFERLGGRIQTGHRITSAANLPAHDILILDTDPGQALTILGEKLPARVRRPYSKFKRGPAAFVVDFTIDGGIPWENERTALAGTVHLGGSASEIVEAEAAVAEGKMPARPFVLLGQQYVADPSRSRGKTNPVYAYAHVPHGFSGDATDAVITQIERFAPGAANRITNLSVRTPEVLSAENSNFSGGDILTGAKTATQFALGPRLSAFPYDTGIRGIYLCSAATPPGPGAHGMAGFNAAQRALRQLKRS